ncbi:MAG: hypothetical protein ABIQ27_08810 [Flavobacterium sp.]|uniref:hypothetical protein n=1 Tax=Flavobacterium sp. TaxID=239 RepID=UPI003265CFCF
MKNVNLPQTADRIKNFCEQHSLSCDFVQSWHIRIYKPTNEKDFIDLYPIKKRFFSAVRNFWGDYQNEISLIQSFFQIQSDKSLAAYYEVLPFQNLTPDFYLSLLQKRNGGADKLMLDVPSMLEEYHIIKLTQAIFKLQRVSKIYSAPIDSEIKQLFPEVYERLQK